MLEDDRKKYGAGQLVKAVLNLKKGATKATGRATEEAKLQKEFDSLMKEHNKDLGKLDELKKSNATEKELTTLKDKIRNDIEDLMILEDSLDAFKNYSPGGRRLEATGGLLSDDRQAYGLGSIVKSFIKKNPSKSKEIKKLEKEMDSYLEDYRKLNDSYEQEIKNAKKEGMSVEEIKDIDEPYQQYYRLYDDNIDTIVYELEELGIKVSPKNIKERQRPSPKESGDYTEPLEQLNTGGLLSDDRQRYALGQIVKKFIKQAEKNKAKAKKKEDPRQAMDDSTDMADRGKIDMEDAIRLLDDGEEVTKVQDFLIMSGYTKKDAKELINIYRMDIDIAKPNMTQDEILDEIDRLGLKDGGPGIEALRKEAPEVVKRMGYEDGGSMDDQMMMVMNVEPMESDNSMESNYTQFIMEEALTDDEEDMLVSKLEKDEELQMLFDKVIDVAQEFAGSGPVDGPGSGVSDSIPARLSDGEFVFTAKATEQIGEDKLMSMMKEAEAQADGRQELAIGGKPLSEEEKILEGVETSDSQRVARKISDNMLDPYTQDRYVRS